MTCCLCCWRMKKHHQRPVNQNSFLISKSLNRCACVCFQLFYWRINLSLGVATSSLGERGVVWSSNCTSIVVVLAIIFPVALATDFVGPSFRERLVEAAGAGDRPVARGHSIRIRLQRLLFIIFFFKIEWKQLSLLFFFGFVFPS